MNNIWRLMASFFNSLDKKAAWGKAVRDKNGQSARQRAFGYFNQDMRPSQLPDLGVKKETLYRYHQSWKHRQAELQFRSLKIIALKGEELRQRIAGTLGVSEDQVCTALKQARSPAQLRKALGIDEQKLMNESLQESLDLMLDGLVAELRKCSDSKEQRARLRDAAKGMGLYEFELLMLLSKRKKQLMQDALLRRILR